MEDFRGKHAEKKIGAVLVVGVGIGGVQASLDLAESGYKVYLVEQLPAIGGIMSQLDKTFPTNDCSMCIVSPKLVDCARHNNIDLLTYSHVEEVSGQPGHFRVKVRRKTRYVDESQCTGCGECEKVCPVSRPNEFDMNLAVRKAIYRPFPQATPNVFTIEKRGLSPCTNACPAHCNAHGYVALIRERKFDEAITLIRERIPLPGICGRVCGFCEDECNRANVEDAIRIRALKRFAAEYERKHGADKMSVTQSGRDARAPKVAIVGSGPAGLTAGYDLAHMGYQPVIFEAMSKTGGMLRVGIPEYRLPDDILDYEIDVIKRAGVEIRTNSPVGPDLTLQDLFNQGFKAIFLAIGTHTSRLLKIEGEKLEGVLHGVSFLREVNGSLALRGGNGSPALRGGKNPVKDNIVAVIGGGNTAIDAVRSALRLGAKDAFIVYRRSEAQMPVSLEELEAAEAEGITIHYLLSPVTINGKDGKVSELVCNRMKLGRPDASGRRRPVPIEGETVTFQVDVIIPALGQGVDYSLFGEASKDLALKWDLIAVDPVTLQTNLPGVFAGGDATTLSKGYVVHAIAHGHEAAVSIDRYLRGEDLRHDREFSRQTAEMPEGFFKQQFSQEAPVLDADARVSNFKEVETVLTEEQAVAEASRCLDCGVCCECFQCVQACEAKAVNHDLQDRFEELEVGAILFVPGCSLSDLSKRYQYGFGKYRGVVTSLQFERILSASGPFGGHIQRPVDGKEPKRIAFIQCVGSRDEEHHYCSSVCCMYALKEAIIAKEHEPDLNCDIFYMDIRAHGKGFDDYYDRAKQLGVTFTRCRPLKVEELKESHHLRIGYLDDEGIYKTKDFDMAVLSVGFQPRAETCELAAQFGLAVDEYGFAKTDPFDPTISSKQGMFVCGPFAEPKDIPETVMEASSASSHAMVYLAEARGTSVTEPDLPPERDVTGEPPRVGVFVCHCGKNIGGYVDVPSVAEYAATLPHVVYSTDNLYTCSSDTQESIKENIIEHHLNRVIVASCTPRTHEPLFQETIRQAGLNPHLFEMANIRDQCSWVHMLAGEAATQKSKDLVRMAVAKVSKAVPLTPIPLDVISKALVVGGGIAGMTSALALADQGYEVFLVEKSEHLGGNALKIDRDLYGHEVKAYIETVAERVKKHDLITVFTSSRLTKVDGFIGNFVSTIEPRNGNNGSGSPALRGGNGSPALCGGKEIEHGVVIVATGGSENTPDEYLYGKSEKVKTLLELSEAIGQEDFVVPETVVFIQCVGSREPEHNYCSRVCCAGAIKNAIRMKTMNPDANIFILYRDIRSYGFREKYYTQAREMGINFIRYDLENKPVVKEIPKHPPGPFKGRFFDDARFETPPCPPQGGILSGGTDSHSPLEGGQGGVLVSVYDPILAANLTIPADLLVLSSRINPNPDNDWLSQLFKVPLNSEKFFLEAHVKLKPVEFATDGVYLCGLAHYPKDIKETISQAMAAAGRAATVLSKDKINAAGKIAYVNAARCSGCGACFTVCPYNAITLDEERQIAVINEAMCKGCGACAATCRGTAIKLHGFEDDQILKVLNVV